MSSARVKKLLYDIAEMLQMPPSVFGGISSITVSGNREAEICGCEKLLLYSEECIRLKVRDGNISVNGSGLTMKSYYTDTVVIKGKIHSIELEDCCD